MQEPVLKTTTVSIPVEYAVQYPETPSAGPLPLLLCLHGYGQTCVRFLRQFSVLREKRLLVVAPQAWNEFYVSLEQRIVGCTWLTRYERDRSVAAFNQYLRDLVEKLVREENADPTRIYVLGFSQGVSMAWRFATRGSVTVSGLVACGADLPPDVEAILPGTSRFPVLLAHGHEDAVVPIQKSEDALRSLRSQRFDVGTFFFQGGHTIPPALLETVSTWISGHRGSSAA